MKFKLLKYLVIFTFSVVFVSCQKENEVTPDPLDGLTKLSEGYAVGASAKVEIWAKNNYFTGYNKLVVVLYDSLNPTEKITDAHIHFMPLMTMDMGDMIKEHACPVENPDETAIDDVFPGAVVFTMPSTMDGSWKLGVSVHNHKYDKEGEVEFDITVNSPDVSVLSMFTTSEAEPKTLILSLLEPMSPVVGMNTIEFTIHQKASMMDFPADDSYTIEITPEMPSMGHGSPNNENPVNDGNGHYKGKVNFTMTGEWKVNVVVKKDGVAVSDGLYFMITF
ncbi:MAG: FixH family protein [Bacteroidales bacterium]